MTNTVEIQGITYEIIKEKDFWVTPEMVSSLGASVNRPTLFLKRPRGKRYYIATRYENGTYSSVT